MNVVSFTGNVVTFWSIFDIGSILETTPTNFLSLYAETFNEPIEQMVILMAAEDGSMKAFVKEPKDYEEELQKAIQTFYDTVNPQLQEVK